MQHDDNVYLDHMLDADVLWEVVCRSLPELITLLEPLLPGSPEEEPES